MATLTEEDVTALLLEDDDDDDDENVAFFEDEDDDDDDENVALFEDEDDDDDDEVFGEGDAEAFFRGGRRQQRRSLFRRHRSKWRPPKVRGRYGSSVRGKRFGTVRTRQGTARIKLPAKMVTKNELTTVLAKIRKDMGSVSKSARRLDKEIKAMDKKNVKSSKRLEGRLAAFEKSLKKKISGSQQSSLLPLLLLGGGDKDLGDLLPLLMMSGGFGSGGNSNQQMMNMLLLTQIAK